MKRWPTTTVHPAVRAKSSLRGFETEIHEDDIFRGLPRRTDHSTSILLLELNQAVAKHLRMERSRKRKADQQLLVCLKMSTASGPMLSSRYYHPYVTQTFTSWNALFNQAHRHRPRPTKRLSLSNCRMPQRKQGAQERYSSTRKSSSYLAN